MSDRAEMLPGDSQYRIRGPMDVLCDQASDVAEAIDNLKQQILLLRKDLQSFSDRLEQLECQRQ